MDLRAGLKYIYKAYQVPRDALMSAMHRSASFSSAGGIGGPSSGSTELSHAGLSANLESHLTGHAFTPSHQFIQPRPDIGLLSAAHLPTGGEAAAFQAAQGAAAGQVSPILQMIMRLPGHIGILSGFFEALGNMFAPAADLFQGIDLSGLMAQAQDAAHTTLAGLGEHLPLDPSLLPNDAPIFQQVPAQDLLSIHNSTANFNVSGGVAPGKPLFEGSQAAGAGKTFLSKELGLISGPSMSGNLTSHLSGNHRLFTDRLDLAARAGSNHLASNMPSPAAANNGLNVGASPFTQSAGSLPAMAQIKDGLVNQQALDLRNLGPSGAVSDQLGGQHLLASNSGDQAGFASGSGSESAGSTTNGNDAAAAQEGPAPVELKAKQLSFQDLKAAKHQAASQAKLSETKVPETTSPKPAIAKHVSKPAVSDQIAHRPPNAVKANHTIAAQSQPAPALEKPAYIQPAESSAPAVSANSVAAAPETTSGGTYTIAAGDNLWDIAKQHLGDGSRWQEIYKLNQDILGSNPSLIHPGTTIQLPDAASEIASNAGSSASGTYTVQAGDNLWDIAKTHLGGGQNWNQIYSANSQIIGSNPGLIHPGQQLTLPGAAPTQISSAPAPVDNASLPAESGSAPAAIPPPNPAFGSPNTSALPGGHPVAYAPAQGTPLLPGAQAATVNSGTGSLVAKSIRPDLSFLGEKFGK